MAVIDSSESISRVKLVDAEGQVIPLNILIYSGSGGGKTVAEEEIADYYHRHGWTIISLSDVKDELEQGFSMFDPHSYYHLRKLKRYGCPIGKRPTKIHHPFTFDIPKTKLPDIDFFTINIKNLNRIDLQFLAETGENKKSIQILLEQIQNLKSNEGLHHLVFYAENQTESMANLTKTGMRFRSDNPDDFFTKSKIGTEKTSGEISSYFKPFLNDYCLAPANSKHNLDISGIMNDQKNYHIFTYKWIKDRRLKSFFILHLLNELILNADKAEHPILFIIEEVRFLVPQSSEGYVAYLAEEIKNTLTRMRNMGKGYGCVMTTQVYRDVNEKVVDTANEQIIGKLTSIKEYEFIGKAMRLKTSEIDLLKSLQVGEFVIKAKEEYTDEVTLQKVKLYMPPHAHKDIGTNFFDLYTKNYPDKMKYYNELIETMNALKTRISDEVNILKEKENETKKKQLKEEKESRLDKEKMRLKIEMAKVQKKTERTDEIDEKLKEAIYERFIETTGKEHSTRSIAKYFKLLLTNGEPNHKAVQRAIAWVQRKRGTTTTTNDVTTKETINDTKKEVEEMYEDKEL